MNNPVDVLAATLRHPSCQNAETRERVVESFKNSFAVFTHVERGDELAAIAENQRDKNAQIDSLRDALSQIYTLSDDAGVLGVVELALQVGAPVPAGVEDLL